MGNHRAATVPSRTAFATYVSVSVSVMPAGVGIDTTLERSWLLASVLLGSTHTVRRRRLPPKQLVVCRCTVLALPSALAIVLDGQKQETARRRYCCCEEPHPALAPAAALAPRRLHLVSVEFRVQGHSLGFRVQGLV